MYFEGFEAHRVSFILADCVVEVIALLDDGFKLDIGDLPLVPNKL